MLILLTERVYRGGRIDEKPILINSDDIAVVRSKVNLRGMVDHFGTHIEFRRDGWFRREPVYVVEAIEHIAEMSTAIDARWNAASDPL